MRPAGLIVEGRQKTVPGTMRAIHGSGLPGTHHASRKASPTRVSLSRDRCQPRAETLVKKFVFVVRYFPSFVQKFGFLSSAVPETSAAWAFTPGQTSRSSIAKPAFTEQLVRRAGKQAGRPAPGTPPFCRVYRKIGHSQPLSRGAFQIALHSRKFQEAS